jgi:hypothetical protein
MEEARTIVLELLGLEGKDIKPYFFWSKFRIFYGSYNLMKEGGNLS